ncbi:tripartite tricarboxylate transporter permease [Paracoccus sp. R12_1]|uniref:tripartite tricarboxylate transporter permease n=1 Tax=unclassified Paracoccus (in: a-proteobacteria) TaxID=2688777 RepID=UPI001AD9A183|nr:MULTISPECIES: tripartite tricarboxylate transporter permease [unclassified Paracoccus (in: a-proteobacteria)]MBO9457025.1 tripartite tricarboxylate transporter permease [Paracoccus sp. R12_2]MBO9488090.1 tripartite tricarboxylate transporter permease [Paracoccus sp. R12_1]
MEILGYLLDALTPFNLLLALVGVILGTVIGALPGLSATMAVAVLVPFTFTMDPAAGLIALGAIYTGAIYGGAYAAILVNTPGTPSAIATTFDGFPMAKRGDGGLAISLATIASVVGGVVGAVALLVLAPPLARVALAFGPTEYFWLAMFGLTLIAALSVGNTLKGLIGACIGLFLSMIGVAVVGGDVRYTMGMQRFLAGIDLTSAIIGLYCVPVILDLVATRDPHLKPSVTGGLRVAEGLRMSLARKLNVIRSSVIGTIIGILPGAGGSIAGLVSYSEARRSSRDPDSFGKGNPDGVIATEAANNATVGGGFIPTLVLGIPGTPPDAIILGALLVQGIKIGPTLFTTDGNIVYTFIWGLLIATLLMLPVGLLIGRYAYASIVKVPKAVLAPTVALLTIIGAFAIHSNVEDAQLMVGLGILAWILNRYGFQPSPIVLGLVLGSIAEQGFVQTWLIGNASGRLPEMFFNRPISIGIILAALITLAFPIWADWKARRRAQLDTAGEAVSDAGAEIPDEVKTRSIPSIIIAVIFVLIGIWIIMGARSMSMLGAVFPVTIAVALIALSLLLIGQQLRRPAGPAEGIVLDEGGKRRLALGAAMMGWVVLMPELGFLVTSLIAFALIMVIANYDRVPARTWAIWLISGAVICTGFWWLMANVLLLRMPAGIFF